MATIRRGARITVIDLVMGRGRLYVARRAITPVVLEKGNLHRAVDSFRECNRIFGVLLLDKEYPKSEELDFRRSWT